MSIRNDYLLEFADNYGFPFDDDEIKEEFLRVRAEIGKKIDKQRVRWSQFIAKHGTNQLDTKKEDSTLKKLVRKGVPPEMRGEVWFALSGGRRRFEKAARGHYQSLVDMAHSLSQMPEQRASSQCAFEVIDKDIDRTFPEHPLFKTKATLDCMKNVLYAYSLHNPKIGYTQSMNFITGILLFHMQDEERVFWTLDALVSDYLPPSLFDSSMRGLFEQCYILDMLLKERRPKLFKHLKDQGIDLVLFSTKWFLGLFVLNFPIETSMRVWDSMFLEGHKILFRISLAYLHMVENELIQGDLPVIMNILQKRSQTFFDARKLMKASFAVRNLSRKTLEKYKKDFYEGKASASTGSP